MPTRSIYRSVLLGLASAGFLVLALNCLPAVEDSTLYLTGTEEGPVDLADGGKACNGKKVLVCHIPPGNPDNAHTICVGRSALEPHVARHGDFAGACASEPEPPPAEPPPSEPPPDEPPPTCIPVGDPCDAQVSCCEGSVCLDNGTCGVIVR